MLSTVLDCFVLDFSEPLRHPRPRPRQGAAPKARQKGHIYVNRLPSPRLFMRGLETASPPPKTERRVSLRVGRGPERGAPHILDKALEIWLLGFLGIVIEHDDRNPNYESIWFCGLNIWQFLFC